MKVFVVSVAVASLSASMGSTFLEVQEPLVTSTTVGVPPSTLAVVTTTTSTTTSTTSTSTTTTTLPDTQCAEWYSVAMDAGWGEDQWAKLSRIMHRESRCIPDVHNEEDPQGGSLGLMQINKFWCKPQHGAELGWLQSYGIVTTCWDLLDPSTNLRAALQIYTYALLEYDEGWRPWRK